MLPKKNRLTKQMIDVLMKNAHKIRTAHFLVLYGFSDSSENPCISMTISKKYAKGAVLRNFLRRRGYGAVKSLLTQIIPSARILVSFTVVDKTLSVSEINKELDIAFNKANLYTK